MKRGCFCDIVNVNKEKQRWKNTTLGDPTRYHLAAAYKDFFRGL